MSLVGSLEDLGLGEILQIISLSRKSGTLELRSDQREGQILFRDGEIRGASLKGQPADLAELLVGRQALPKEEVDRLLTYAHERGEPFEELLIRHGVLSVERLDGLRLECVERVVLSMFRWVTGDFSFEVHAGHALEPHPGGLTLSHGINPQFLALEGTRLQDEAASDPKTPEVESALEADAGELDFSGLDDAGAATEPAALELMTRPEAAILIEPDLGCLEVTKRLLADSFSRVHAFQRSDLGIGRIRQYLGRGEVPLVLLSDRTPADSLTGARDWRQILGRLKVLAPRMPVLLLAEEGEIQRERDPALDGVLPRPGAGSADLVGRLDALMAPCSLDRTPERVEEPLPEADLIRLRDATELLRDPDRHTEVIPLVLRFAAGQFSRAAIFMLQDERAVGMAQSGLPRAGGPDDQGLREVALPVREPAWFRRVLEACEPCCEPALDKGDQRLAVLLGNAVPAQAYVGPIQSGGRVVALLYADQLPRETVIGDVRALGAVLREAGAALDRALQRAAGKARSPAA
jgi:hypothetical protein